MMHATQRGSLWRVWDFHIHTPASHQWDGAKLENAQTEKERECIIAATVEAMRNAEPDVFVIMDYWTFDGYLAIKNYAEANPGILGNKVVIPGIEIRMESSHPEQRLNVHFVLEPSLSEQRLMDFLGRLKLSLRNEERGISNDCFIEWARELGTDKLQRHNFDKSKVDSDDQYALHVGRNTAEVTSSSALAAHEALPPDTGLMLMPWDTYGGMSAIKWVNHYAEVRRLMQADIFECKDIAVRECFHGKKTDNNATFFDSFWDSIGKEARLCVRGTDAHKFSNYGVFPSGMKTWIKAEPSFLGLKQAIKEPACRSFIGDVPPKKSMVEAHGSLFLERLKIKKKENHLPGEDWFDTLDLELNTDLVAIIGNKGSGKSGLADVLALAGNSKLQTYFSFLNPERFKAGATNRASAFEIDLHWYNGDKTSISLDSSAIAGQPERIKYISQRYFEELCNEHISGKSDRFAQEIKGVLFSKMDAAEKLSFENLDAYLVSQESAAKEHITQLRAKLHDINVAIALLDEHLTPTYRNELIEKLETKRLALRDLEGRKPNEVPAPTTTKEAPSESIRLIEVNRLIEHLSKEIADNDLNRKLLNERRQVIGQAIERLVHFKQTAEDTSKKISEDLAQVGINFEHIIIVQTKADRLQAIHETLTEESLQLTGKLVHIKDSISQLQQERSAVQESLDGPNKMHQQYLTAIKTWEEARSDLIGTADKADSQAYFEAKIVALGQLPEQRKELENQRSILVREIYNQLKSVADSRKPLFKPVEQIVDDFPAIKEDLRIDFQSQLFFDRKQFTEAFFSFVKKSTGGFRGDIEGELKLDQMIRNADFNDGSQVVKLLNEISSEIVGETSQTIHQILRVGTTPLQLYDKLFGLEFLEPKFSLSLAGTTMQQMSPGQRGALLLIFYLVVDSDQAPLVLDQPEENLDNQTVFSMLVPVIKRAKERRQIVMVTHNANLAVCCDAEQIIFAHFDRSDKFKLTYQGGAIETPAINEVVVNVLEGTAPAFINRRRKYLEAA
jgi:ABC-type lipoprotein export system ATPase subunit